MTVEVWDGAALGTGCIPRVDFRTMSLRPDCYGLRVSLAIDVGDFASTYGVVEEIPLPAGIYFGILLLPIMCYVAVRWFRERKHTRKKMEIRAKAALLLQRGGMNTQGPSVLSLFCRSCDPEMGRESRRSKRRCCCGWFRRCTCSSSGERTEGGDQRPLTKEEHEAAIEAIAELNALYPCGKSSHSFEMLRRTANMKGTES